MTIINTVWGFIGLFVVAFMIWGLGYMVGGLAEQKNSVKEFNAKWERNVKLSNFIIEQSRLSVDELLDKKVNKDVESVLGYSDYGWNNPTEFKVVSKKYKDRLTNMYLKKMLGGNKNPQVKDLDNLVKNLNTASREKYLDINK